MRYFVTGIDTDSGKTFVSAILCEALKANYWKPIQAGLPRDADTVKELVSFTPFNVWPERHLLKSPMSPHAAAKIDNIHISLNDFTLPGDENLIVEGAGGCLVPINDDHFIIDLITRLNLPVILVADLYLGSINHTLLTIEALQKRSITIKGIIFNGVSNPESERIILHHSKLKCLLHVSKQPIVNKQVVRELAAQLIENL